MKSYNFFFNLQPNYFIHLKHLLLSLKMYKRNGVEYNCIIAIDDNNLQIYKNELKLLQSFDFNLIIYSSKIYEKMINPCKRNYIYYVRCLLPSLCTNLDKILFLDCDILILKEGIEDFYDLDLTKYYVAACQDHINEVFDHGQKINCHTNNYFNGGVLLLNLKKMREDGIDQKLKECCLQWPKQLECNLYDQTLNNWAMGNKVLLCSPIFNNQISFASEKILLFFYIQFNKFGYKQPQDSFKDTVVLHFLGAKIWNKLTPEEKKNMYYYDIIMKIYQENLKKLLDFEFFLLSKE